MAVIALVTMEPNILMVMNSFITEPQITVAMLLTYYQQPATTAIQWVVPFVISTQFTELIVLQSNTQIPLNQALQRVN